MAVFKLTDQLTFGKHRGQTLEQVIKSDPQYIRWCLRSIEWFEMDKASIIQLLDTPCESPDYSWAPDMGGFCPDNGEYPETETRETDYPMGDRRGYCGWDYPDEDNTHIGPP